jgi:hypothetical protein
VDDDPLGVDAELVGVQPEMLDGRLHVGLGCGYTGGGVSSLKMK